MEGSSHRNDRSDQGQYQTTSSFHSYQDKHVPPAPNRLCFKTRQNPQKKSHIPIRKMRVFAMDSHDIVGLPNFAAPLRNVFLHPQDSGLPAVEMSGVYTPEPGLAEGPAPKETIQTIKNGLHKMQP